MQTHPARPLPQWAIIGGTVGIVGHVVALLSLAIASQSGPWWLPSLGMPSAAEPPEFARVFHEFFSSWYLRPLHLTQSYHFASNMPERATVKFEVRLLDKEGRLISILPFPDPKANYWVQHRQSLLAQSLGDDRPLDLRDSVRVAASPTMRKVWFGKPKEEQRLDRKVESELLHLTRTDAYAMGFSQPAPWTEVLAHSYARHLLRKHDAYKAEVVRMSREPINPVIVMPMAPPKNLFDRAFNTLVSNFGEFRQ